MIVWWTFVHVFLPLQTRGFLSHRFPGMIKRWSTLKILIIYQFVLKCLYYFILQQECVCAHVITPLDTSDTIILISMDTIILISFYSSTRQACSMAESSSSGVIPEFKSWFHHLLVLCPLESLLVFSPVKWVNKSIYCIGLLGGLNNIQIMC